MPDLSLTVLLVPRPKEGREKTQQQPASALVAASRGRSPTESSGAKPREKEKKVQVTTRIQDTKRITRCKLPQKKTS